MRIRYSLRARLIRALAVTVIGAAAITAADSGRSQAATAGADAGLPAGPEAAERVAAAGRDGVTGAGRHWELAVKFYLCLRTQGQAQASDYWGPDLEEHFPVKLDKLLRIPILSGIVKKKILKQLGLDSVRFAGTGAAPLPPSPRAPPPSTCRDAPTDPSAPSSGSGPPGR